METIQDEVRGFVIAVRILSRNIENIELATDRSRTCLLLTVEGMLKNKALRVHVLAAITGIPITTQSLLCQASTSAMIDQFKTKGEEERNERIIQYIEEDIRAHFAKDPLGFDPHDLYSWER